MKNMDERPKLKGKTTKSRTFRAFVISLVLLIVLSIVNWGCISGWGSVKIHRIKLASDDGVQYSALMYIPENATKETPAPLMFMMHGMSGHARTHEAWCIEYSRRGFVCISIDFMGAGESDYAAQYGDYAKTATPMAFINYVRTLPYVDQDQLCISGHSYGGELAYRLGVQENFNTIISANGLRDADLKKFDGNLLLLSATADKAQNEETLRQVVSNFINTNGYDTSDGIVSGKVYGSFEEGNANCFVDIPDVVHEGVFISAEHIAAQLTFVQQAIDTPNPIDPADQVWRIKDFLGLAGMLVFAATLCLMACCLTEYIPAFQEVKQPLPRNIGLRGKGLAISIAAAILFPLLVLYTGAFGLNAALGGSYNALIPLFQMRGCQVGFGTLIAISLLGLLMFGLFLLTDAKKAGADLRDLGMTVEGSKKFKLSLIGKAFAAAMITVVAGWTYLTAMNAILGTDFYCMYFGFKPLVASKFKLYIPYIVVWMICFVMSAISMNVERRLPSTGNEKLDTVIAVLFNGLLACATVTAMVTLQNSMQISMGRNNGMALGNWGTDMTRIIGMPVGMFMGACGNTYCYRKTGNIWLGVFLMGTVCALSSVLYGMVR